jgi:branched-chain amino acid transport system ATP-binding protein
VSKSFGGVVALNAVDLSVARGEIVGLAGANGAGKTTLLNAIGGQIRIDSGDIAFEGEPINRLSAHTTRHRGIARTFQVTRVFSTATVLQNAALSATYAEPSRGPHWSFGARRLEMAMDALRRFSLEHRANEPAGRLSVYEKKRLMLACATVRAPRLLLLDEPVGGLSPEESAEMVEVCRDFRDGGGAVVVVEHVMSFLAAVADRVVILHEGANLSEGTPDQISRDPRVRAAWLGEDETAMALP